MSMSFEMRVFERFPKTTSEKSIRYDDHREVWSDYCSYWWW
ncbi:hypothetical protein PSSM7_058 [Prochlorococcus phage P-SSM7]|uniref:Uncharacterized protein n=1 Tax=Prochlorococcus phage P-SSM7 TaxID=445688 RepID=E3SNH6_9CAUD|nr:hypothetical protein PSSM7_058 [Prochlorococcus phage P-SSM7]ADO99045.1 hypothetical protein PSSM7_058 [Prochlorococcus phage P-SSM7]